MKLKLLNEGDLVEVTFSKAGYKGPGELAGIAYGINWMVKIPSGIGRNSLITVNAVHLTKISEPLSKNKIKIPQYDPKDSLDETEERLKKKRKGKKKL